MWPARRSACSSRRRTTRDRTVRHFDALSNASIGARCCKNGARRARYHSRSRVRMASRVRRFCRFATPKEGGCGVVSDAFAARSAGRACRANISVDLDRSSRLVRTRPTRHNPCFRPARDGRRKVTRGPVDSGMIDLNRFGSTVPTRWGAGRNRRHRNAARIFYGLSGIEMAERGETRVAAPDAAGRQRRETEDRQAHEEVSARDARKERSGRSFPHSPPFAETRPRQAKFPISHVRAPLRRPTEGRRPSAPWGREQSSPVIQTDFDRSRYDA